MRTFFLCCCVPESAASAMPRELKWMMMEWLVSMYIHDALSHPQAITTEVRLRSRWIGAEAVHKEC